MIPPLQLRQKRYFPAFLDLPDEYEIDKDFHTLRMHPFLFRPVVRPSHHWVFLGEIIHDLTFFRPRYVVKDRDGNQVPVHFHHKAIEELVFEFDPACYVVGHTIAMFYAETHAFMDMTHGIRVESLAGVKLIPCSLEALLSADPATVDAQDQCAMCKTKGKDVDLLRCTACKTKYCGKKCQKDHWKTHKAQCVALQQVRLWSSREWDRFAGIWKAF